MLPQNHATRILTSKRKADYQAPDEDPEEVLPVGIFADEAAWLPGTLTEGQPIGVQRVASVTNPEAPETS